MKFTLCCLQDFLIIQSTALLQSLLVEKKVFISSYRFEYGELYEFYKFRNLFLYSCTQMGVSRYDYFMLDIISEVE